MDQTGTYVVQSVRRVPEEQRHDNRLLRNVRGTPREPNPSDMSTDLPEPTPVRVFLVNTNVFNFQTRNLWSRDLNAMPKCRLAARMHQSRGGSDECRGRPDRCLALKRKAEGDPHDSEVENTEMDSLVESWRENNDPNDEIDLLICQQRNQYVASAHETGTDRPVCEEPKTPFPYDEVDGITSTTRAASCSTTLLSKRRGLRRFRGCRQTPRRGRVWHSDGSTSTRVTSTSPSTAVFWSCRSTSSRLT